MDSLRRELAARKVRGILVPARLRPSHRPECERATEAAKRELGEEWRFIERVVFVENGWDAFTWDGEWRAFRTDG